MAKPDKFAADITDWVKKEKGNLDKVVRKIVLDLGTRIIMRSPVRTGRFRANWQYGLTIRPSGVVAIRMVLRSHGTSRRKRAPPIVSRTSAVSGGQRSAAHPPARYPAVSAPSVTPINDDQT